MAGRFHRRLHERTRAKVMEALGMTPAKVVEAVRSLA
jgi:hypothetical protein